MPQDEIHFRTITTNKGTNSQSTYIRVEDVADCLAALAATEDTDTRMRLETAAKNVLNLVRLKMVITHA